MSTPKRHHFVPKCYLANFASNDLVYVLDIRKVQMGYNVLPRQLNTTGICYLPHYYLIQPHYQNETFKLPKHDELIIEVDILKKLEDKYPILFNAVITGNIQTADAKDFCDFIIFMKLRNPYYLNNTLNIHLNRWTESTATNLMDKLNKHEKFKHKQTEQKEKAIDKVISGNLSDKNYAKQVQLYSLYHRSMNNRQNEDLRKAILTCQWKMYKSPDNGPFFITTDNPGISTCEKGLLYNTKFAGGFTFYFPLSPRYCLVISDKVKGRNYQKSNKVISVINVDINQVYQINDKLIQLVNNLIIANEESYLSQVASLNKPTKVGRQ